MKISQAGLRLIKQEEQFRGKWYRCAAGKPTIGYGHVIQASEGHYYATPITEAEASALLQADVDKQYAAHVASRLQRAVTQNQFDALVSLCYNIGTGGFDQSSVLRLANAGPAPAGQIEFAFGLWNKVTDPKTSKRLINSGLTRRRAREAALYLS
ncbi:MAG: lysozyme [Janthinobacterium lividum]